MDDCIKNMQFCTDLINYLMKKNGRNVYLKEQLDGYMGKTLFQNVIGDAVAIASAKHVDVITNEFLKSIETKPSLQEVAQWAMSEWSTFLYNDLNAKGLLAYCGIVWALIECLHAKYEDVHICEALANALCNRIDGLMLFGVFQEAGIWDNLISAASDVLEKDLAEKFEEFIK